MEFCIKKCCVIIMNRGKVNRIELPSCEKIREKEEDRYKNKKSK